MRLLALLMGLHTRHAGVYCIMSGAVSGDRSQSQSNSLMKSGWFAQISSKECEPPCRPVMGRGYVQGLEGMMAILSNKQHVSDF